MLKFRKFSCLLSILSMPAIKSIRSITSITLLLVSANCFALRCGTDLIEEGDLKIHVEEKCGEPISKEVIGYTLRRLPAPQGFIHEREFLVEEWIYKFRSKYYDVLTFEAGRLKRMEKIRR